VEVIADEIIRWHDGVETKIFSQGGPFFWIELGEDVYRAKLAAGRLVWDDGDVWVPLTHPLDPTKKRCVSARVRLKGA